jgi:hypothetical protein
VASTLLLWLLYGGVVGAAAGIARWLRRPVPPVFLLVFFSLPVLFLFPGFVQERTQLPVDHARLFPPWIRPDVERHNANLNDIATEIAPWAKAVRMAWKEGSLPLRNRWNGAGMSLAANGQSAAFSPLTFVMFLLPLAKAFTLLAALKLFWALAGAWLWLKEIGVSREASLFGSIAFSFSLTMTPWLLFPLTAVIAFWPWALFAIELLRCEETRRRALPALAATFVLWAVNGHPESAASGAGFAGLWLLARRTLGDLADFTRVLRRVAAAALLALGLTAFVLLPLLLAIRSSNRLAFAGVPLYAPVFSLAPHGPAWPNGLFMPFFPRLLGDAVDSPMVEGGAGSFPEMALAYFGIAGWACLLLALRPGSPRSRTESSLLVPLLFGLFTAVGLWPFAEIAGLSPGLKLMIPLRFFSWAALAGAAVAAFELDRLQKDLAERKRSAIAFSTAAPAALALFALAAHARFRALHVGAGASASQKEALISALVPLGAFLLCALFAAARPAARLLLPLGLALISGAELFAMGARLYRFGSPADLYPPTPAIELLRARPTPFRVAAQGAMLFPHTNIFAGLEDIRTHDPVERRDYIEFLDATAGYRPAEYFKQLADVDAPSLDFLNVRFLLTPPGHPSPGDKWKLLHSGRDAAVFENARVLPRVFAPRSVELVQGAISGGFPPHANGMTAFHGVLSEMKGLGDFREKAFVLGAGGDGAVWPEGAQPEGVAVADYRESTNAASFRASNPMPGRRAILVASLVQDGGWSARDETGSSLSTTLANGPFLALSLPPGEHRVALRYRPPGFALGGALSLATLAGCGILLLRARRGRRSFT